MPLSTQPRPGTDGDCHGQHGLAERVAMAASLCGARGVQLTKLRRHILELLWESSRPTGAYELVKALERRESRPVGPPTVYRALEFLISQGLAAKIESRNAYVACTHPERNQDCLFFICDCCGETTELEDQRLDRLITENATQMGFRAVRRVIEVEGMCTTCAATGAA